jgi:erythrose-4-phosphate dehydrogenase
MIRLAINGYGRIGRCVLRAIYESAYRDRLQVVAINEPADLATIVHLTRYDSTHGRFNAEVQGEAGFLYVNGDRIAVTHYENLAALPWQNHGIDMVLECSGSYDSAEQLQAHLDCGAKAVLLSQPGQNDIPAFVYGINHRQMRGDEPILSAASCTSNCIVPVIDVLAQRFGVESGTMTTIHSVMNDQPVLDGYHHTDLRKTRASSHSVIPVDTGLAAGIGRILPELEGRFTAKALRVPTTNVSAIDLTVQLRESASVESVNSALQAAAGGDLMGVLGVTDEPLASCDFNHDKRSAIVDLGQTRVSGALANVLVWFDNEWAYANRMLDLVIHRAEHAEKNA